MQDQQYQQLTEYIQQARQAGVPVETIHTNLLSSGWPEGVITQLLTQAQPTATPTDPHRVRNAVLWIVGPFAALIIVVLIQFIMRFITDGGGSGSVVPVIIVNLVSFIVGIVAVPMMIVGPIVGIVKLSKK